MASTFPLSRSIAYAQHFVQRAPLLQASNEPALSAADWVRQTILSPPFGWRWNRILLDPVILDNGVSDYKIHAPTLGWVEKAVVQGPILPGGAGESNELKHVTNLGIDLTTAKPQVFSVVLEDKDGNHTVRISPTPDARYSLQIIAQSAPPSFTSTGDFWSPIPDRYSFLYNQGLKAVAMEYFNDPRFLVELQQFLRQLVAASDGLDETQKNLFLDDRLDAARSQQQSSGKTQIGWMGRGGLNG